MSKHNKNNGSKEGYPPEQPQNGAAETGQTVEINKEKTEGKIPETQAEGQNGAAGGGSAASGAGNFANVAESAQNSAEKGAEQPAQSTAEEKIVELEIKLAEITDQLLRKAADFENFRKRMNQEKQNSIEFANQSLLLDIIPIIDDFERAIQSAESTKDFEGFLNGVKMIEKQLISQLDSKWGLKRFNSAGELFDPNIHEALMVENAADVTEAVVREDLIKGYWLKDRLIRAAKVKVAMPMSKGNEQ